MFSLMRSLRPGLCELGVRQLQFVKLLLDRPRGHAILGAPSFSGLCVLCAKSFR
jgi:hypothetical protein